MQQKSVRQLGRNIKTERCVLLIMRSFNTLYRTDFQAVMSHPNTVTYTTRHQMALSNFQQKNYKSNIYNNKANAESTVFGESPITKRFYTALPT